MNKRQKNILWGVFAIVLIVLAVCWFFSDGLEHIVDSNGDDDYSLTTITDENIINMDIGAIGLKESKGNITNTTSYSSKKYTGVSEIYGTNIIVTNLEITINHAKVTEGNFKIVLVVNDEIVHEFTLNELTQTYTLKNVSGYVSLRIAGESANFMFDYRIM